MHSTVFTLYVAILKSNNNYLYWGLQYLHVGSETTSTNFLKISMFPTIRNVENNEILEMGVNLCHEVFGWKLWINLGNKEIETLATSWLGSPIFQNLAKLEHFWTYFIKSVPLQNIIFISCQVRLESWKRLKKKHRLKSGLTAKNVKNSFWIINKRYFDVFIFLLCKL